jgi:ATP-dependent helicase/nuclease subunit A
MAAYRAVLRAAFPGKRVEAALVYTAGPKLLLLPDEILDAHWPPAVP